VAKCAGRPKLVLGSLGRFDLGIEMARVALASANAHYPTLRPYALAMLAQVQLLAGDLVEAAATIDAIRASATTVSLLSVFEDYADCQLALA
jgi:hypothetical protein